MEKQSEATLALELGWRVFSTLRLGESYSTVVTRAYFAGYDPSGITLNAWQKRTS
jgi:hypothetical protein